MAEFDETKRLLDEINAAISQYDPILREHARDILLKSMFGLEIRKNDESRNQHEAFEEIDSPAKMKGLTLKDYAETWMPRTENDRALLSLYYLKKALGLRLATGHQISKELKENGMGINNISVAMQENVRLLRARSRVIRGEKSTRQSRNEYAITNFGIEYIESRFCLDSR